MNHYRTCLYKNERLLLVNTENVNDKSFLDISINRTDCLQKIIGFGGAITEATSYNLLRVSPRIRESIIKAYFDPKDGIGYTMGRISIHGCDFSLGSYLYIDDYDDALISFDISRDQPIIQLIHDAQAYTSQKIKLIASPWTPPFWMKDNQSPIKGGRLLPKYYHIWADYFVKFIQAYEAKDTHIFAVTIQNEPMAKQRWDSCIYENEDELRFLKVLGPTLEEAGYHDKHILIWDHNRDMMVERASHIYQDEVASKYAWGTAFHWYDQEEFVEVQKHKALFPNKHLIFTEGCQESGPHIDNYSVGERYGKNIINDLRNGTEAYLDWNLCLDETGGPNHVNNLCSSPIILNVFDEVIIMNPSYYYIGHISKFVKPGAVQIKTDENNYLFYVAFINPDNSLVFIIQNQSENDFTIKLSGILKNPLISVIRRSISTLLFSETEW